MGAVKGICISKIRGIQKHEVAEATLKENWGLREMPMRATGRDRSACWIMRKSNMCVPTEPMRILGLLGKT